MADYVNPRKAEWPKADFIVGNPPFIGNKRMRAVLGDGYCDALRSTWSELAESSDFVMFWWHAAAVAVSRGSARQFGLIATNSLTQAFNRLAVQAALKAADPIYLAYAIADHPWVDNADGASVRISMTVGRSGSRYGTLAAIRAETARADGSADIELTEAIGHIHANLSIGADVAASATLRANAELALRGITVVGAGFVISETEVGTLGYDVTSLPRVIRKFLNGRDVLQANRKVYAIDLFGLSVDEARAAHPSLYQWLLHRVKPERDQNARSSYRDRWWTFAEPRSDFRLASVSLRQYIATPMTAKHRLFVFVDSETLPDQGLVPISIDDPKWLGVLSSRAHIAWSIATGGTLEDRPRYNQSECFDSFPFPDLFDQPALSAQLAATAQQLDAHRNRCQAAHAGLTLTDMYNVLDALRLGRELTEKEKITHTNGLVSVLAELHDRIDTLVLQAYGWSDLAPALVGKPGGTLPWAEKPAAQAAAEEELLVRLVALNAERAAEEARGEVRWLRPEFQDPARRAARVPMQDEIDLGELPVAGKRKAGKGPPVASSRRPWPSTLPEQVRAVADVLMAAPSAMDEGAMAEAFTGRGAWKKRLPGILLTLEALGRARREGGRWRA